MRLNGHFRLIWTIPLYVGMTATAGQPPEGMVYIPAGKFRTGLTQQQSERFARHYQLNPTWDPVRPGGHEVDLPAFYIDKYEVTNQQYKKFIDESGYKPPIWWLEHGYPNGMDNYPVTFIDCQDAEAYAKWAGKRLPTSDEWEKAARGTDARLWPWGNRWEQGACVMDLGGPGPMAIHPSSVGSHPRDRSVYGVMDMAGNVAEWCPVGIVRGGSFAKSEPYMFACSYSEGHPTNNGAIGYIGFRCAMDAAQENPPNPPYKRELEKNDVPLTKGDLGGSDKQTGKEFNTTGRGGSKPGAEPARRPDPSLYRTDPLRILPIYDLDPTRKNYINAMFHYLTDHDQKKMKREEILPWMFEIRAPYLPSDRFAFFFENLHDAYYGEPMKEVEFKDNFTFLKLRYLFEGRESTIEVQGGLDYIDILFVNRNHSDQDWNPTIDVHFDPMFAPNFRDHDASRTFILVKGGFQRLNTLDYHHYNWQRLAGLAPWPSPEAGLSTGPLTACVSRDREWLISPVSLSGKPERMAHNRVYGCLHCIPPSHVPPGEQRKARQRIYFLKGNLETLIQRYETDTGERIDASFKAPSP